MYLKNTWQKKGMKERRKEGGREIERTEKRKEGGRKGRMRK